MVGRGTVRPAVPRRAPPFADRRFVVTSGGTREPIDPVRYIGNRSSGRMGNAIALAAADRGARVTLITTVAAPGHARITAIGVGTADEMYAAVKNALPGSAVLVMAAAVADYRVADIAPRKLKKRESLTLDLVPTVDILADLTDDPSRNGVLVVGFAAETDDIEANARRKLAEKRLDLIVLNDVSRPEIGMGSEDNAVSVFDAAGLVAHISQRPKPLVAEALLDIVAQLLSARGGVRR
jgi:phosphopantothenoylcysteine decarboxylase / phosphopantothenate---cysteine ligase